jgi:hypothetical protein
MLAHFLQTRFGIVINIIWRENIKKRRADLSRITDKLYHIMFYYTSPWTWFELTTLALIGIDCTCTCKSSLCKVSHWIWDIGDKPEHDPLNNNNYIHIFRNIKTLNYGVGELVGGNMSSCYCSITKCTKRQCKGMLKWIKKKFRSNPVIYVFSLNLF